MDCVAFSTRIPVRLAPEHLHLDLYRMCTAGTLVAASPRLSCRAQLRTCCCDALLTQYMYCSLISTQITLGHVQLFHAVSCVHCSSGAVDPGDAGPRRDAPTLEALVLCLSALSRAAAAHRLPGLAAALREAAGWEAPASR